MSGINLHLEFCCTCLKVAAEDDKFLSLGSAPPEDISYKNKLKSCIPEMGLENTEDCYLCKPCSVALETAYTFRCMCLRTESKLEEFRITHRQNCRAVEKNIKLELIEQLCTEEITIEQEPEQKYRIDTQLDEFPASCSAEPEQEYPISVAADSEDDCVDSADTTGMVDEPMDIAETIDIEETINIEETIEIEEIPIQLEEQPKQRDTNVETVKDQLGSLLSESLGNTKEISISIFDKTTKSVSEVQSELNIFNSLNAEIEELTRNSLYNQKFDLPKQSMKTEEKKDIKRYIKEMKIFPSPKFTAKKKELSDEELLAIACKTIPELHNFPIESLQCRVSLEKITVTEQPVKLQTSSTQKRSSKGSSRKTFKGILKNQPRRKKTLIKFWCYVCKKDVVRRDRYNAHILKHSNIRAYKCKTCWRGFFSGESLNKHKKTCDNVKINPNPVVAETSTSQKTQVKNQVSPIEVPKVSPKKDTKKKKTPQVKTSTKRKQTKPKNNIKSVPIKTENQYKFKGIANPAKIRRSQRKLSLPKRLCHLNDEIFRCELCSYQGYLKQKFQIHMLKHANNPQHKCEECPKTFFERWELNRHVRNSHSHVPKTSVPQKKPLKTIVRKVTNKKIIPQRKPPSIKIKTEIENDSGSDFVQTIMEPAITLTVNQGPIITPIIQSIQSLAAPPVPDEVIEMSFSCKKCNISFRSRNLLILHTQTHEWKHKCDMCNQEFISERDLSEHVKVHIMVPEEDLSEPTESLLIEKPPKLKPKKKKKRFFCTVCNMEFACRDHANVHTGAKPYTCKYCGKQFAAYSTLRKHRLTHIGKDVNDSGTTSNAVRQQPQTNTQRKKYVCEICKKEFIKKEHVYSHNCHNASGESVYRCQICKNAFIGRTALIEHMGLHVNQSGNATE